METSLSDLPEDLLNHIFTYIILANHEAIRLSLVSKQFQRILQHRPTLVFDTFNVPNKSEAEFAKKYREDLNYMHSTLERYHRDNIPLESFALSAATSNWPSSITGHEDLYNRCIELAAKKCPRNLRLWMNSSEYVIPQHVFESESLVDLTLDKCCLMPESIITWPNLKRLSIASSYGSKCVTDEDAFGNIIRGCPSIEYLKVNSYWFTGFDFKVSDLRNLKKLVFMLGENQRLAVDSTPNLESVQCAPLIASEPPPGYFLGFHSTEYPNLRSLEVKGANLDKCFFINFETRFPVLEKLNLNNCNSLQGIDLSSNSLEEIKLVKNRELEEACFDVPNLVHFEYEHRVFKVPKLTLAGNSGRHSSCCIKLVEEYSIRVDEARFLELHQFLAALNMSETSISVTFFGANTFSDLAVPVIADSVNLVPMIREFSLYIGWKEISLSSVSAVLDYIFSICRPQTMTFEFCTNIRKFATLLYKKLVSKSSHHYRDVADFEMFGTHDHKESWFHVKDWDKLLEVLAENKERQISFQLEYCSGKSAR